MIPQLVHNSAICLAQTGAVSGCAPVGTVEKGAFSPDYLGIDTRLLDRDLVKFIVTMRGARTDDDVADYARCAAAQYALIRGYGFARHVRTLTIEKNGVSRGDAVYTISAALPKGLKTIDAEVVVSDCIENGIPRV